MLRWKEVAAAAQYELQVSSDAGFKRVVLQQRAKVTSFKWEKVPPGSYFWRVRTIDANGRDGPWSAPKAIEPAVAAASDDEVAPLVHKKPPPPPRPARVAAAAAPVSATVVPAAPSSEPAPSAPPVVEADAATEPPHAGAGLEVGVRGGVLVAKLGAGPQVGLDVSLKLTPISARLRLALFAGWAELSNRHPQLLATRGYDPAVIENVRLFPISLGVTFDIVRSGRSTFRVGVGGGVWVTRSQLILFSTSQTTLNIGGVADLGASYRLRLGPGELAVSADFLTGALPLPAPLQSGLASFNAFSGTVSYAFNLFNEESHQ